MNEFMNDGINYKLHCIDLSDLWAMLGTFSELWASPNFVNGYDVSPQQGS